MSLVDPALLEAARALAGAEIVELTPCTGGGNNRVFRLVTPDGVFALKAYRRSANDVRDRLGAEYSGLRYASTVAKESVPATVAADPEARIAIYEWIEGSRVSEHGAAEIEEVVRFLGALHAGRNAPWTQTLPYASEAILRPEDLREQLERRLTVLGEVGGEPDLEALLRGRIAPLTRRFLPALDRVTAPSREQLTLSPSDFGFHNAMRRAGRLVFLDFEYFGWDDPAKLVCDFLWHPGMVLSPDERSQFLTGVTDVFIEGTSMVSRLRAYEPLIALRWATIVLGEFLPEVRERRRYAARGDLDRDVTQGQLAKAHAIIDRLENETADRTTS